MVKLVSFYLPQFHPIKENDEWWGKGFTEWTNVAGAKPRYKGHQQPHIPADLGFYDLRIPEVRRLQAEMAGRYGINGFCYYHYWFNGKRLLDTPINQVVSTGEPDFPFCVCWANENWTRAWDGLDREVLIGQDYSDKDALEHFHVLASMFRDKRYIRIDGKPLLLIYRPDNIPDTKAYFERWRELAKKADGFSDIYLCAVKNSFVEETDEQLIDKGFDAIVDFQPNRKHFPRGSSKSSVLVEVARRIIPHKMFQYVKTKGSFINFVDYKKYVARQVSRAWPESYKKFPVVFPSWDNTARRKTPTIIQNDDPGLYGVWLNNSIKNVQNYPSGEQVVFINAWNEWAEGCHLEPDKHNGHGFLEETARATKEEKGCSNS